MSDTIPPCPQCQCDYTYHDGSVIVCPECSHEWTEEDAMRAASVGHLKVVDANGTVLQDGDSVVVIKDLKVKGASNPVKQGTLVKNIQLVDEAGHNISCKITGFGAMNLKSEFVKKA